MPGRARARAHAPGYDGRMRAGNTRRRAHAERKSRVLRLTAVYAPCPEGGFAAEVLEADSVVSQGETLDEARENLAEALRLMLEEAPHQVGRRPAGHRPPPYTIMEPFDGYGPPPPSSRRAT